MNSKGTVQDLGVKDILLIYIKRNPLQPRVLFEQSKLEELAYNIRDNGLLQPIVVREIVPEKEYVIIAGERRYRAHDFLGFKSIQSRIIKCDDQTAYELSLLENIQRENLSLLEEARGYKHLKEKYQYKLSELAKVTSKSVSSISNIIGVLDEDPAVQKYIEDGTLTLAALVWIKQLPNLKEKLSLLEKLRNEEVKRTNVREYVERVKDAYEIATRLGLRPEDILNSHQNKGKSGRFDNHEEVFPEDFKFYFIVDFIIEPEDIPFMPSKNILLSAYNLMYDKGTAKRLSLILMEKKNLDKVFIDSGVMPAAKREDWKFFDNIEGLIGLYESIKPNICTSMDVPMYQFVFDKWKISKQKMLDITIENAKKFMAWKPTFETVKVYPIQGTTKEEYLESFKRLISIGAFDTDDKVAIAFGGLATAGRHRPVEVIDYVTKSPEFKQYQKKFQFIHGFGIGNPERILSLYKLGVNSFDALTVCLLTNIGMYWLRTGKLARHLIHESPMTRRLRLHFNMNSFWGQLAELFSKHRNIPLKEELEKIDMSKIDEICEIQEEKE